MKILLILALLSVPFYSIADNASEIDDLAKPVMELFKKKELTNIASTALSGSSIADYISKSDMAQSDGQFEGSIKIMGKYFGSKVLHEQEVDNTFIARWYLLRFERQPVLIHMEFYKPDTKWQVHSISMDTDMDDYIKKSGTFQIGRLGSKSDKES